MKNKNNIALVVALVGLVVGGWAWLKTPAIISIPGTNTITQVGGVNPDIPSPYVSWGGVQEWRSGLILASSTNSAGTTTICALPAPSNASSTLVYAGFHMNTGTTTAMTVRMSKQANQFPNLAAPTYLGQTALASLTDVVGVATTTDSGGGLGIFGSGAFFPAGYYLLMEVKPSAGGAGTSSPQGTCAASWISL